MIFIRSSSSRSAVVSVGGGGGGAKHCRVVITAVVIGGLVVLLTLWLVTHKVFSHPSGSTLQDAAHVTMPPSTIRASDCLAEPQYAALSRNSTTLGPFYLSVPRAFFAEIEIELTNAVFTSVTNLVDVKGSMRCRAAERIYTAKYLDVRIVDGSVRVSAPRSLSESSVAQLRATGLCETQPATLARYAALLQSTDTADNLCVFTNVLLATLSSHLLLLIIVELPVLAVPSACTVQLRAGLPQVTPTQSWTPPLRTEVLLLRTYPQNASLLLLQSSTVLGDNPWPNACMLAARLTERRRAGLLPATLLVRLQANTSTGLCSTRVYVDPSANHPVCASPRAENVTTIS